MDITVETTVDAPLSTVWQCWTAPEHITQWNFAADTWHCPSATNDVRIGGQFSWRMEAKDGSAGFDFKGTYTEVEQERLLVYTIEDGRPVRISFVQNENSVTILETFEAENLHTAEQQREGWQAILEHFRRHVELLSAK